MILDGSVQYEVSFSHPKERVWRALTEPDELAQWLMPSKGFEAIEGTQFTLECDPIGLIEAEVLQVQPPRLLVCRWSGSFGDTMVSFELDEVTDGVTQLTVRHEDWGEGSEALRDQFDGGWSGKLARLGELLDRRASS